MRRWRSSLTLTCHSPRPVHHQVSPKMKRDSLGHGRHEKVACTGVPGRQAPPSLLHAPPCIATRRFGQTFVVWSAVAVSFVWTVWSLWYYLWCVVVVVRRAPLSRWRGVAWRRSAWRAVTGADGSDLYTTVLGRQLRREGRRGGGWGGGGATSLPPTDPPWAAVDVRFLTAHSISIHGLGDVTRSRPVLELIT